MIIPADPRGWRALFLKVLTYYLVLLGSLLLVLYLFPVVEAYLPVGGLEEFGKTNTFEEVVTTYQEEASSEQAFRGVYRMLEALLMSAAIGLTLLIIVPITWVYRATHANMPDKKRDRTVLETLVVLPVVITAVVLIIQNSIALAFGLAGIVAGVQYRNRLALSVDATYLFAAIAIGIASGIEAIGVALVMAMWFCLTIVGLRVLKVEDAGD